MLCPKCGKKLFYRGKHCPACGEILTAPGEEEIGQFKSEEELKVTVDVKVKEHAQKVFETVASLNNALNLIRGSGDAYRVEIEKAMSIEEDADTLRRIIMGLLKQASLAPILEFEMVRFVSTMDTIADTAKDTARVLYVHDFTFGYSDEIYNNLLQIGALLVESMYQLKEAINAAENNREECMNLIERVENCERSIDSLHLKLLGGVLNTETSNVSMLMRMLALEELVLLLEETSDRIEDSSDILREMCT